ncbi:MAG TPA: NADH-quinone oxidoreductase subunit C, partial [Chryseolinea sp.]
AIMYQLHNLYTNTRLRLKIYLPVASPTVPTLTRIFAAANWMERETYDFYGVIFEGHPNLTRILNVDEMIIFPMRKEYPLEDQVRQDKNDTMFGR